MREHVHSHRRGSRLAAALHKLWMILAVIVVGGALVAPSVSAAPRPTVRIQLLDISDWHGQLDPLSITGVGNVGGAAVLSSYFKAERAANPRTLTLTAGDSFGAAPPLSAFFNDEPAVNALNLMGLQVDTFGNHNFDRGTAYLQNLINLADYDFVSSNLDDPSGELYGVAPFQVYDVGGVRVGVIGVTNPEAPTLVLPGSFGAIQVVDPISSANHARALAAQAGAKVFVAITHLGVEGFDAITGEAYGPLIDFANNVGNFDVIFGDHTDIKFSGTIKHALVVENKSKGATYARVTLDVDPVNGRVDAREATFVTPMSNAVVPDPAIVAMLAPYRAALGAEFDVPVAVATGLFVRGNNIERLQEVPIGDLITDAFRWHYGTQLAFTNGGGIRAPLPSSYLPANHLLRRTSPGYAAGPPYDLVVGDIFTTLPFGNVVVTRTVTGAQLHAILEFSVGAMPAANGRFGQISGFRFTYSLSAPAGARVQSVELDDGTPIPADATTYTFATNDFTNAGGDGYAMLADGQGTTRELMADVVLEYVQMLGTISPVTSGRITKLP